MNLDPQDRKRCEKSLWAVEGEPSALTNLAQELAEKGCSYTAAEHYLTTKNVPTLDFNWETAEVILDLRLAQKYGCTLYRKNPTRGWRKYLGKGASTAGKGTNDCLFGGRPRYG